MEDSQLQKQLIEAAGFFKINLSEAAQKKLITYLHLLLKWNHAYNLVGTNNPEKIITEHILDSLSIAPYIKGGRIIDIGTGAGFPGIPLALTFPGKQVVLLDSVGKKVHFLAQAIMELQLNNVEVIQARAESYQPLACFDHIVLRAFGTINDIISKTKHLCCPEGSWLMMKGLFPKDELENWPGQTKVYPLKVPGLNKTRHLVCIEKKAL